MGLGRIFIMAASLALLFGAGWASFASVGVAVSRDVGAAAVARGTSVRRSSVGVGNTGRLRVK